MLCPVGRCRSVGRSIGQSVSQFSQFSSVQFSQFGSVSQFSQSSQCRSFDNWEMAGRESRAILQANLTATGLKWLLISRKSEGFMEFKTN